MNRMKVQKLNSPISGSGRQTRAPIWVAVIGLCVGNVVVARAADGKTVARGLGQVTGTVEIEWRGKGGPQLGEGETRYAFASFAAFPNGAPNGPRGEFVYSVLNPDLTLHRAIVVELFEVVTDPTIGRAWMAGIVVDDIKTCSGEGDGGSGTGGHDDSCDDGCSDTTHDDGCGGSDIGGMPAGDSGGTTPDGGCGDSEDGTTHDDGCAAGGSDAGGGKVSGKNSRVGQMLLAKVKDFGTPGWTVDHITWKWFSAPTTEEELAVTLDQFFNDRPDLKLCKKTILSGNLVVH